jgi:hypothetical protein
MAGSHQLFEQRTLTRRQVVISDGFFACPRVPAPPTPDNHPQMYMPYAVGFFDPDQNRIEQFMN